MIHVMMSALCLFQRTDILIIFNIEYRDARNYPGNLNVRSSTAEGFPAEYLPRESPLERDLEH